MTELLPARPPQSSERMVVPITSSICALAGRVIVRIGSTVRSLVRYLVLWAACLLLGYWGGLAISSGVSAIAFPLGPTAASFAVLDDRVSRTVQHVLATRTDRYIATTRMEGGAVAVAISGDRSMVAVGVSSVRPQETLDGRLQVGLFFYCDGEAVNLGTLDDGFFSGPTGEGWENSVAIEVPDACTDLVITLLEPDGELIELAAIPVREAPGPTGELAMADAR